MAMNRKQYRQLIVDTYGLPDEYPSWVNDRWLNVQIDRAHREVSELTECIQGSCGASAVASGRTFTLTTDFIRVRSVEADTNSASLRARVLEPSTTDKLEAVNGNNWRSETGAPVNWYVEDQRHLGLFPCSATAGSSIYVYGPRYAAALSADTTTSEIATSLEGPVVAFVCRELATLDESPAGEKRLIRFGQEYERGISKYRRVRPMVVGAQLTAPRRG